MDLLPSDAPSPRLCHLIKWPDFDGYGFNLHAEKAKMGQFIGKVDVDSPAQMAGLREGDRIIEVNGVNISGENHRQVVERIKSHPEETKLLVVDQEADEWYKENDLVVKSTQLNVIYIKTPVPRPSSDSPRAQQHMPMNNQHQHHVITPTSTSNSNSTSPTPQPLTPLPSSQQQQITTVTADSAAPQQSIEPPHQQTSSSLSDIDNKLKQVNLTPTLDNDNDDTSEQQQQQHPETVDQPADVEQQHQQVINEEQLASFDNSIDQQQQQQQQQDIAQQQQQLSTNHLSISHLSDNNDADVVVQHEDEIIQSSILKNDKKMRNGSAESSISTTPDCSESDMSQSPVVRPDSTASTQSHDSILTGDDNSMPNSIGHQSIDLKTMDNGTLKGSTISKTSINNNNNNSSVNFMECLNLNMTASEMRELISRRKKFDPKKAQMNIRQKYEIIQQM